MLSISSAVIHDFLPEWLSFNVLQKYPILKYRICWCFWYGVWYWFCPILIKAVLIYVVYWLSLYCLSYVCLWFKWNTGQKYLLRYMLYMCITYTKTWILYSSLLTVNAKMEYIYKISIEVYYIIKLQVRLLSVVKCCYRFPR